MSIPDWSKNLPWNEIIQISTLMALDRRLIAALIQVESSGNRFVWRYEAKWKNFVDPLFFSKKNEITEETERFGQSCSFGLMQIMGATARENSFQDQVLKLTEIYNGIFYGCSYLKDRSRKYKGDDLISAYNCGTPYKDVNGKYANQDYVDKVLTKIKELN